MFARGHARRAGGCYTEFCDPPKSVTPGGANAHFLQHAEFKPRHASGTHEVVHVRKHELKT